MEKKGLYLNDKFREQYAIVVKHLICQPSQICIYQLERFAYSKPIITKWANAGLQHIWNNFISKKFVCIGQEMVIHLGHQLIGGLGVAAIVAIGGLLYLYDNKYTKKTSTTEEILTQALVNSKIQEIKDYFKAYQLCFSNVSNVKSYCQLIRSQSYLIKLLTDLNQVSNVILKQSQMINLNEQLKICGLFYKIAKIVIHIYCLTNFNKLAQELQNLQKIHKQIKKVMTDRISKNIQVSKKNVSVINLHNEKFFLFLDENSIITLNLFAMQVFDVIFRCPITKLPVDDLFKKQFWLEEYTKSQKFQQNFKKSDQILHLGRKPPFYSKTIQSYDARIKIININKEMEWSGYYQQLKDNSGCHDYDFKPGKEMIEFDKIKVLFLCRQYGAFSFKLYTSLKAITNQHKIVSYHYLQNQQKVENSQNMSFCVQFDNFSYIKEIKANWLLTLQFCLEPKNQKRQYGPFTGLIASIDKAHRLSFAPKKLMDWTTGLYFQVASQTDRYQKLIFQAISSQQKGDQISQFFCRITNEYNQKMYLARDNRDQQLGGFTSDVLGAQIIRVQVVQKLGKRQCLGKLYIITPQGQSCSIYLKFSNELFWIKDKEKNKGTKFYMNINQE